MLEKIRNAVKGKKTYIVGCIAVATSLVAWSVSEISTADFAMAIFVALQTMFVRAGVAKVIDPYGEAVRFEKQGK